MVECYIIRSTIYSTQNKLKIKDLSFYIKMTMKMYEDKLINAIEKKLIQLTSPLTQTRRELVFKILRDGVDKMISILEAEPSPSDLNIRFTKNCIRMIDNIMNTEPSLRNYLELNVLIQFLRKSNDNRKKNFYEMIEEYRLAGYEIIPITMSNYEEYENNPDKTKKPLMLTYSESVHILKDVPEYKFSVYDETVNYIYDVALPHFIKTVNVEKKFRREDECVVCYEPITGRVIICQICGTHLCDSCSGKISTCPYCREDHFTNKSSELADVFGEIMNGLLSCFIGYRFG